MFRFVALVAGLAAVAAFAPRMNVARSSSISMASIVDTADKAGSFKTLIAALDACGLSKTLGGGGPFTVFAPTDAAFDKLPKGTVEKLLKDIPKLKNILLYHVVAKEVKPNKNGLGFDTLFMDSNDLPKEIGVKLKIVPGKKVMDPSKEESYVFSAADTPALVETMAIKCDNGLIHVIDGVLLPYEDGLQTLPWMNLKEPIN